MPRPPDGVGFGRRLLSQALLAAAAFALLVLAGIRAGWTGLLVVLCALIIGAVFPALRVPDPQPLSSGADPEPEPAGARAETPQPGSEPTGSIPSAMRGSDRIGMILALLAGSLGGGRLVLWQRDDEQSELVPIAASHDPPRRVPAPGDPLAWVLEQGEPMRLDSPPAWSSGPLVGVPLPGGGTGTLLTIESDGALPEGGVAESIAATLAVLLDLEGHRVGAERTRERLDRMQRFLSGLRGTSDSAFPDALLDTAISVAAASGGLVASWGSGEGEVLVTAGADGGPARGARFGGEESDLVVATRLGASVHRAPDTPGGLPLATKDERWSRRPPFMVTVPLLDPGARPRALLAVWGEQPMEPEGIALLEAVGPLLAIQMDQAVDLDRFQQQATRDPLTGLANRGRLEEELRSERQRWERYRRSVALLVLDLDHFKAINDTHGHPAGDAVLTQVAAILEERTRDTDLVARYGGEEMVVLMPETMRTAAIEAAERIRVAIEAARIEHDGTTIPVTASIGVSACPECVDDPAQLVRSADAALYRSKEEGRNRVTPAAVGDSGG